MVTQNGIGGQKRKLCVFVYWPLTRITGATVILTGAEAPAGSGIIRCHGPLKANEPAVSLVQTA